MKTQRFATLLLLLGVLATSSIRVCAEETGTGPITVLPGTGISGYVDANIGVGLQQPSHPGYRGWWRMLLHRLGITV